jgi:hypothetical protein
VKGSLGDTPPPEETIDAPTNFGCRTILGIILLYRPEPLVLIARFLTWRGFVRGPLRNSSANNVWRQHVSPRSATLLRHFLPLQVRVLPQRFATH